MENHNLAMTECVDTDKKALMNFFIIKCGDSTEPTALSYAMMNRELFTGNPLTNPVLKHYIEELSTIGFLVIGPKKGAVLTYCLNASFEFVVPVVSGSTHDAVEDQEVLRTPAGTEVLAIFKDIDTMLEGDQVKPKRDSYEEEEEDWDDVEDDEEEDDEEEEDYDDDDHEDRTERINGRYLSKHGNDWEAWPRYALERYARSLGRKGRSGSHMGIVRWMEKNAEKKVVSVPDEVFFQYVKSNMTESDLTTLTERLTKLSGIVKSAQALGQTALYETMAIQLSGAVREQEIASIGLGKYIDQKVVKKMLNKVPGKTVKFGKFDTFPRVIAKDIADQIIAVQQKNVFDEYHILYIDASGQKALVTNEEKIRRKDPILFGKLSEFPERLYFIIDWTDEFCNMTLDKMVEHIKVEDPEFALNEIGDVTPEYIASVMKDIDEKHLRLKTTSMSNWRRVMKDEARETRRRAEEARNKTVAVTEKPVDAAQVLSSVVSWIKTEVIEKGLKMDPETGK